MVDISLKVPALEKLLDYCASGVGAVGGPMLARWKARTDADVLRIKAQGQADAIRLITDAQAEARQSFEVVPSSIHGEIDIRNEIQARLSFQEEKRQGNIEAVVGMAADELGKKQVQAHDVDHDWTARFFADVQDVSSEKMQQIWAKILAGEVETPGRTSMQTLSILRNMSQRDAELFERMANFVIDRFVFMDDNTKSIEGFPKYGDFMRLSHHDLIHLTEVARTLEGSTAYHCYNGDTVYRIHKGGTEIFNVEIPCHALTPSGEELYAFVICRMNEDYLGVLADFLKKRGGGRLAYAQIVDRTQPVWPEGPWIEVEPRISSKQE